MSPPAKADHAPAGRDPAFRGAPPGPVLPPAAVVSLQHPRYGTVLGETDDYFVSNRQGIYAETGEAGNSLLTFAITARTTSGGTGGNPESEAELDRIGAGN